RFTSAIGRGGRVPCFDLRLGIRSCCVVLPSFLPCFLYFFPSCYWLDMPSRLRVPVLPSTYPFPTSYVCVLFPFPLLVWFSFPPLEGGGGDGDGDGVCNREAQMPGSDAYLWSYGGPARLTGAAGSGSSVLVVSFYLCDRGGVNHKMESPGQWIEGGLLNTAVDLSISTNYIGRPTPTADSAFLLSSARCTFWSSAVHPHP
ncbi:hypothetical protein DFH09DRAFT_1508907, partial [Mycena vulgaris]